MGERQDRRSSGRFGPPVARSTFRAGGDLPAAGSRQRVLANGPDSDITIDVGRRLEGRSSYLVQVSSDNGRSWRSLGVGLQESRLSIDWRQFEPGRALRIG